MTNDVGSQVGSIFHLTVRHFSQVILRLDVKWKECTFTILWWPHWLRETKNLWQSLVREREREHLQYSQAVVSIAHLFTSIYAFIFPLGTDIKEVQRTIWPDELGDTVCRHFQFNSIFFDREGEKIEKVSLWKWSIVVVVPKVIRRATLFSAN